MRRAGADAATAACEPGSARAPLETIMGMTGPGEGSWLAWAAEELRELPSLWSVSLLACRVLPADSSCWFQTLGNIAVPSPGPKTLGLALPGPAELQASLL